eukprot:SAG22_NODE_1918_length_3313_cov_4.560361_2_plen_90_part_00
MVMDGRSSTGAKDMRVVWKSQILMRLAANMPRSESVGRTACGLHESKFSTGEHHCSSRGNLELRHLASRHTIWCKQARITRQKERSYDK